MTSSLKSGAISVPQAFALARQRHAAGALDEARDLYKRILNVAPDHGEALVMLASIAYRQDARAEAETCLDRAINLFRHALQNAPDNAGARGSLINLLLARDRGGEAEALIQDLDIPLNPIRATPADFAARREAAIAQGRPVMLISTLPKSASESIWNKLAEGLGLAQCYLSIGLFPDYTLVPARVRRAAQGGVIVKEHVGPSRHNVATLVRFGIDRLVVHHRDPRQAALSWAHFARDDINQRLMAPLWRKIVPPAEVLRRDLAAQLDWTIDQYLPYQIEFLRDWRALAADPDRPLDVLFMSFELFRRAPERYFEQVLDFYGIARERFAAEAEATVVHLRKGQTDEWRGVFTEAQRRRAWELIPADMAEAFGWEP